MNADGSGRVDLTPPALMCPDMTRTMGGSEPDWSPDGKRIVFTGPVTCANSRGTDIWVMNADGSAKTDLIGDDATEDGAPVFSPAGDRIAFTRDDGAGLHVWTMNADGGDQSRLPAGLYAEDGPDWADAYGTVRLTEKVARHGRRLTITGKAKPAQRGTVTVLVTRNGTRVARKHARLHHGKYRLRYTPRKPGRYTAVATLPAGAHHLRAVSPARKARVTR